MANEAQPDTWLTARRLRAHALLLGATLWLVYLWTLTTPGLRDRNGNLKGTDFLHFYTLGWLAQAHRGADLYDVAAQSALVARVVPDAAGIRYLPLYPPQVSIMFAPLARLPYGLALAAWWLTSAIIYAICCNWVWRACPGLRSQAVTVALLTFGFPAFFHSIAWGQASVVALGIFTLTFIFLRDEREFLAGLAFGCLIFKPQLGLAGAIVLVATGAWRVLAGAAISGTLEVLAGVLFYGPDPFRTWVRMLENVRNLLPLFEPKPYQTHCLRTFWSMMMPWETASFALYLISAGLVLIITAAIWKRRETPLALRYSALLLASVLVASHLTVYDLVILAPALLLLADWIVRQPFKPANRRMGNLLYLVYMLPLVGPLSRWSHVQLSVIAMAMLLYLVWRQAVELGSTGQPGAAVATQAL